MNAAKTRAESRFLESGHDSGLPQLSLIAENNIWSFFRPIFLVSCNIFLKRHDSSEDFTDVRESNCASMTHHGVIKGLNGWQWHGGGGWIAGCHALEQPAAPDNLLGPQQKERAVKPGSSLYQVQFHLPLRTKIWGWALLSCSVWSLGSPPLMNTSQRSARNSRRCRVLIGTRWCCIICDLIKMFLKLSNNISWSFHVTFSDSDSKFRF